MLRSWIAAAALSKALCWGQGTKETVCRPVYLGQLQADNGCYNGVLQAEVLGISINIQEIGVQELERFLHYQDSSKDLKKTPKNQNKQTPQTNKF